MFAHDVFAMGPPPGSCSNEYAAKIISYTVWNGSQTFDPLANPGLTFQEKVGTDYVVTDVLQIANQSNQGNNDSGYYWENFDYNAFEGSGCIGPVTPNEQITEGPSSFHNVVGQNTQAIDFSTTMNSVSFNIQWIAPPSAPQSLTATATTSSQINLSWTAPSSDGNDGIAGYEIQRSTDGGSTWSTIVVNTDSTATTYSDTGLSSNTTYNYQVFAINSAGTSPQSNTVSATTPILTVGGINVGTSAFP